MKKLISILLSALMIFSVLSVGVSAADEKDELKITVANDLHYNLTYGNYKGNSYYEKDYSHVASSNGQLWIESILIIDTFFTEMAENDSEIILIPGDLVDHGTKREHEAFSSFLAKFEESSKKRVYVVPGNHDYYGEDKVTPAEFSEYYKAFGYSEAIAKDPNSASYVAELNDEYRLFAIDSCKPGDGVSGIDEERKAWIVEQAQKAEKDGKKVISMMHHNLLDHFIFGQMVHPGAFVNSEIGLPEIYAQYNIKYNLTGHTHSHDIKAYTGSNGVTVYDILTSSLNLYPLPYRNITFGEEVKIETDFIEDVDVTGKKGIISENCYNLASEDFQAYALACTRYGLGTVIDSFTSVKRIESLLKLDPVADADLCSIIEKLLPAFTELLNTPIYRKDAMDSANLEVYAGELNLTFPETDIKTFRELGIFFYEQYVAGDENFGLFSAEYVLFTATLTTILNRLLADVSAEDYSKILNYLVSYFNLKSVGNFGAYAGDTVSKIKGIDIFVSALGSTLFLHFTTDELPEDNNAVLPGYEEPAVIEEELSLWDKIVNFFLSFFDYILRIFGIGK